MSAETKAHIFEPFFTTKEVGKGTGTRSGTVYGVVKQSGGFVWVESAIGEGATFEIYLPKASERASRHDAEDKPAAIARGHETILVVEDENDVRDLACEFLTMTGYSVLRARNGVEAIDLLRRHPGKIDLVLSDVVMPRWAAANWQSRLPVRSRPAQRFCSCPAIPNTPSNRKTRTGPQHANALEALLALIADRERSEKPWPHAAAQTESAPEESVISADLVAPASRRRFSLRLPLN